MLTALLKENQFTGAVQTVPATPGLIKGIAYFNGAMTPTQVEQALEKGQSVYTAFSIYRRAA